MVRALVGLTAAVVLAACGTSEPDRGSWGSDSPGGKADGAEDGASCQAGELDRVLSCVQPACDGLTGHELEWCALEHCSKEIFDLTTSCQSCLSGHEDEGIEGIKAACHTPACTLAEYEPVGACVKTHCGDLSAPQLESCALSKCGEELGAISSPCLGCLIDNEDAGLEGIEKACTPVEPEPEPEPAACAADKLGAVQTCALEHCADLVGAELTGCALEHCAAPIFDTSLGCQDCMLEHQDEGISGIANACGPLEDPDVPACEELEFAPLDACVTEHCTGAFGTELVACAGQHCLDETLDVSPTCSQCLLRNADGGADAVRAACR
jgi:hypothetical protein